jgi:DHA2 family multidrug resistance protein
LLTVGLACFQIMLEEGQQEDWFGSNFIIAMAAGAVVGVTLLIWRELTIAHPAVDLRVLRHRSLAAGSVYSLVLGMGLYGVMFAVPIFVQNFLHFTATQSGLLLMPGALAAAVMMLVMGKISGRIDARLLVAGGAMITVSTALLLADINPSTGTGTLFWPLILRGLGSVMMFVPLSLATLGSLPRQVIGAGAGFYNLTRQLGSSIGIALITTILAHREAVHRAILVEKVPAPGGGPTTQIAMFNSPVAARLQLFTFNSNLHSADPVQAQHQALQLLDRTSDSQAMLLSFADVFRYVAVAFLVTLPLLFLLGQGRNRVGAGVGH